MEFLLSGIGVRGYAAKSFVSSCSRSLSEKIRKSEVDCHYSDQIWGKKYNEKAYDLVRFSGLQVLYGKVALKGRLVQIQIYPNLVYKKNVRNRWGFRAIIP